MYFVPLISPEPVSAVDAPGQPHQVRVLSISRRSKGASFQVTCEFEFVGEGHHRNNFDYKVEVQRHEEKLRQGRALENVLTAINVEGSARGAIEVEGTEANGRETVNSVRLRFNSHGVPSPVTIDLRDLQYHGGNLRTVKETVARVNSLTFQRKPGPPKMEVGVASVKPKDAGDSLWQNLKGNLKGMAVNLLIPPLEVDARGHQAMLDFGRALASESATFTFPPATNLVASLAAGS
jgi:hypothetical protein